MSSQLSRQMKKIGNYQLGDLLGRGSIGTVYKGLNLELVSSILLIGVHWQLLNKYLKQHSKRINIKHYNKKSIYSKNLNMKIQSNILIALKQINFLTSFWNTLKVVVQLVYSKSLAHFQNHQQPFMLNKCLKDQNTYINKVLCTEILKAPTSSPQRMGKIRIIYKNCEIG